MLKVPESLHNQTTIVIFSDKNTPIYIIENLTIELANISQSKIALAIRLPAESPTEYKFGFMALDSIKSKFSANKRFGDLIE